MQVCETAAVAPDTFQDSPVGGDDEPHCKDQQDCQVGEQVRRGGAGKKEQADEDEDAPQQRRVEDRKGGLLQARAAQTSLHPCQSLVHCEVVKT
jgi:hypothetical protein